MKLRNILYGLAIIAFLTSKLWGQNTNPVVENVLFSISGQTVTVTYDVKDAAQNTVTIRMEVSSNNGSTWDYDYGTATGVGAISGVLTTFSNKTITWTYSGAYNDQFQIRIFANDETADGSPCAGTEKVYYEGGPNNDGAAYYKTVQIGTQCWLKENLNVGVYVASTYIYPEITHSDLTNNGIIEKYCYRNNEAYCATFGGLYGWNEAMQYVTTAGAKGICPTGWHIPTKAEFQTVAKVVNSDGNSLKAVGQGTLAGVGTNTSGFSALLAGDRDINGNFYELDNTYVWSSTASYYPTAYFLSLPYNNSNVTVTNSSKDYGFSIRCLKY